MTMAVGGLALHWGGACNRFSEEDLRLKSMYGLAVDWPIDWKELERYYCEAERALNVAGEPSPYPEDWRSEPYPQPADAAVLQPAVAQGLGGAERAQVLRAAAWRGTCRRTTAAAAAASATPATICPTGARYSPDFTFKQLLERKQIVLHDRTLVRKLALDETRPTDRGGAGRAPGSAGRDRASIARGSSCSASGYCWSPHLLLLSANVALPERAGQSLRPGRPLHDRPPVRRSARDHRRPDLSGQNSVHSLISREYFRCPTDKPFVRHDMRVWESRRAASRGSATPTAGCCWATRCWRTGGRAPRAARCACAPTSTSIPSATAG